MCRMSSKEKISVQDQSKERKTLGTIAVGEEETSSASEEETPNSNGRQSDVAGAGPRWAKCKLLAGS